MRIWRALHRSITQCFTLATPWPTACIAGLMVLGPMPGAVLAEQPTGEPAEPVAVRGRAPASPPESAAMYKAFRLVEQRVRDWDTDGFETAERFAAVTIELRLNGELIGLGADDTGDRMTLARALTRALARAERSLHLPRDALYDESMRAHAERLTIALAVAGGLVPFAPEALADASLLISPGVEGVAARLGERTASMFPGRMVETGTLPSAALRVLVAQVSGDPALGLVDPAKLQSDHGITLYRFAVRQIAQELPDKPAILLVRGGQYLPRSAITTASLRHRADDLARHMLSRTTRRVVGVDLLAMDDPADLAAKSTSASPLEQALAAIALTRYAALSRVDPARAMEARAAGIALVLGLADQARQDAALVSSPAVAALVSASITLVKRDDPNAFHARAALVDTLDRRARATLQLVLDRPASVPGSVLPPVAYALALRAESLAPEQRRRVEVLVRAIYQATPRGMLVTHMPWLGWTELELARGADRVPAAGALRQMRDLVLTHQLTGADAGADAPDLVGGIVFTASRTPLPTWQAVRPLAFMATMLGDIRLTSDAEVAHQLAGLVSAHRFLGQLALDPWQAASLSGGHRGLGGITAAPWDRRLFPEASALTLIFLCETLDSIDTIQARRRANRPDSDP